MGEWQVTDERPLSARSVIASVLLGVRPPRLRTRTLMRACALFDISDGTGRVALSRMVAAGELTADGDGYALAGALLARSARQDRSAEPSVRPWRPGDAWVTALVTGEARSATDRTALRRAATDLRLAELREGVWVRPDNLGGLRPADSAADAPTGSASDGAAGVVRAQCVTARAALDLDPDAQADLAARLWDLTGWNERARSLERALARSLPALDREGQRVLAEAFVLSAAVLRHLQGDPLLPPSLLPAAWGGDDLRDAHRRWRIVFDRAWIGWTRADGGA